MKSGLSEPAEVKKYTEEYQSESDLFIQFMKEKMVESDDGEVILKLEQIFFEYKEWFRQTKGNGAKCPSRKELKANISKKFGNKSIPNNKNAWIGLKIKD